MVWGYFSWIGIVSLVPVKGHLNTTAYKLVESLPRRVEGVTAAEGGPTPFLPHDSGMRRSTSRCPHTFWSCSVI
jgi:hypothetical protein